MRILVIDDDVAFLGMLRAALEEDRHVVATATDGGSGLVSAARQAPDAIILDLRMPPTVRGLPVPISGSWAGTRRSS